MRIARTREDAVYPEYKTAGSAGFDFALPLQHQAIHVLPNEVVPVHTGWIFELSGGYAMLLFSRSGHAAKFRVGLANAVGLIDSDYRGEIIALIENRGSGTLQIKPGDRFAQGLIILAPQFPLLEVGVEEVTDTVRGAGGFGSTG